MELLQFVGIGPMVKSAIAALDNCGGFARFSVGSYCVIAHGLSDELEALDEFMCCT